MKLNTSMNRSILIVVISLLTVSCNQSSTRAENSSLAKSVDSLKQSQRTEIDTTEIDFPASSPGNTKVLLENEYVRVIEYTLKPGEKDNTHTHPPKTSYVVSGGLLRIYPENGEPFDAEGISGTVEWGGKVGKHYVENIGKSTVKILLTEVKSAQK